jgi:mono/diheme cytochrome c family protein/peroxiredoxin
LSINQQERKGAMRIVPLAVIVLFLTSRTAKAAEELPANVTFAEHIAPIVFHQCATCHRPGQVAPFSLLNYADTRKHAKTMLRVIQDRYMPPWQPEPGYGEFRNERRLTQAQIALFDKWVKTGMAEGDPQKTPKLPKFPDGWRLGTPDLVVKMDRPFEVPADGPDIYQNFVIPLGVKEDKWVTAVEFRASAPEVVHHVLYFLDNSGRARAKIKQEGQPGFSGMGFRPTGSLGGWAVGAIPIRLPDGLAYPLSKGSDLVLQTHFHLSGKPVKEELTVGIYFADKPPQRTLANLQLPPSFGIFSNVDIPAGQAKFKVTDSFILPVDVDLVAAGAHAHYLGKTMQATAKLPDGTEKKLFSIRDWDFNWQGQYLYKDFVRLPKGTILHGEVTWDNSAANPRNPTIPPVQVRWGEGSKDEMGQVNLLMVAADEANKDKSRLRGDKIDWEKLGVEPPPFWKDPPATPSKQEPKEQSRAFPDLDGKEWNPLAVKEGVKANVLFFITTDCPIANSYVPEIKAIAREFADAPIRCFAIQVDPDLTLEAARKHTQEFGLSIPVLIDAKHQLVSAMGVTHTPEVAVVLPDGTIAYQGRIDDRYPALGKKRSAPATQDLRDALSAIVSGKKIRVSRTDAVGCSIPDLPEAAKER